LALPGGMGVYYCNTDITEIQVLIT